MKLNFTIPALKILFIIPEGKVDQENYKRSETVNFLSFLFTGSVTLL